MLIKRNKHSAKLSQVAGLDLTDPACNHFRNRFLLFPSLYLTYF